MKRRKPTLWFALASVLLAGLIVTGILLQREAKQSNKASTGLQQMTSSSDVVTQENTSSSGQTETNDAPTKVPTQTPTEAPTEAPTGAPTEAPDNNGITVIAGGKWDYGPVTWKVTSDGVLTISGNKGIQEYSSYIWKEYSDIVTRIVVEDGITSIPKNAFSDMKNVSSIY